MERLTQRDKDMVDRGFRRSMASRGIHVWSLGEAIHASAQSGIQKRKLKAKREAKAETKETDGDEDTEEGSEE